MSASASSGRQGSKRRRSSLSRHGASSCWECFLTIPPRDERCMSPSFRLLDFPEPHFPKPQQSISEPGMSDGCIIPYPLFFFSPSHFLVCSFHVNRRSRSSPMKLLFFCLRYRFFSYSIFIVIILSSNLPSQRRQRRTAGDTTLPASPTSLSSIPGLDSRSGASRVFWSRQSS